MEHWLVAGLGNPGNRYERTWHNCGFMTMEILTQRHNLSIKRVQFKGLTGEWRYGGKKITCLKPMTFMNNSGESIRAAMDFYKIPPERLIVIYDDVDLETGIIRIREHGGPGSHNGMRSIVQHVDSYDFIRVRVGIGPQPVDRDIVDYVLAEIPADRQEDAFAGLTKAADAVEMILTEGTTLAMSRLNGHQ